ncbi:MAG: PAS domain-containing protein [Dehalococcoidia bacterium]
MNHNVKQPKTDLESGSPGIDLERIADFGEDGLLVIDRDYRVHFANLVMRQRLVLDACDFLEKRCYEAFEGRKSPCTYPLWKCPLTRVLHTGNPARIIHVDHPPVAHTVPGRYVEVIMYPLRDMEGNINGFTEIRRDVTAERGLESYMLRQHHHLQALNRISSAVSGLWDLDEILRCDVVMGIGATAAFQFGRSTPAPQRLQRRLPGFVDGLLWREKAADGGVRGKTRAVCFSSAPHDVVGGRPDSTSEAYLL